MYVSGVSFFRTSPIVFQLKPSKPCLNVTSIHETIHDNLQHGSYTRFLLERPIFRCYLSFTEGSSTAIETPYLNIKWNSASILIHKWTSSTKQNKTPSNFSKRTTTNMGNNAEGNCFSSLYVTSHKTKHQQTQQNHIYTTFTIKIN